MIRFCSSISNRHIDIDSISKHNYLLNQVLFKSGLHSMVSEEEKLCLRFSRLSAGSAGLAGDVSVFIRPRCHLPRHATAVQTASLQCLA